MLLDATLPSDGVRWNPNPNHQLATQRTFACPSFYPFSCNAARHRGLVPWPHACTVSHSQTAYLQHHNTQRRNATTHHHHHHQSPEASAAFLAELPRLAKIVKEATGADVSVVDCATIQSTAGVRCRLLVCRPLRACCETRSETQSIRLQVEGRALPGPKGGQNYRERGRGGVCGGWVGDDVEGQRERGERNSF